MCCQSNTSYALVGIIWCLVMIDWMTIQYVEELMYHLQVVGGAA